MPMQVCLNLFMIQITLSLRQIANSFVSLLFPTDNSFPPLKSLATIVALFSRYCFVLEQ